MEIVSASDLPSFDTLGKSDPYCKVYLSLEPEKCTKTPVIKSNLDPVWNFKSKLYLNLFRC